MRKRQAWALDPCLEMPWVGLLACLGGWKPTGTGLARAILIRTRQGNPARGKSPKQPSHSLVWARHNGDPPVPTGGSPPDVRPTQETDRARDPRRTDLWSAAFPAIVPPVNRPLTAA